MKSSAALAAVVLFWAGVASAGPYCSGVSDQRLVSIMASIDMLTEQLYQGGVIDSLELSSNVSSLRVLLEEQDDQVVEAVCQLATHYPSIEVLLEQASAELAQTDAIQQLAMVQQAMQSVDGRGSGGSCLTEQAYDAVRSTLFVLRVTFLVLQGICDTLGCATEACRGPCLLNIPTVIVLAPFEATLTQSVFICGSNHYSDMTSFYEQVIGVGSGRGSVATLDEIEQAATNSLLPLLEGANANVAQQDLLQQAREDLDDRLQAAQQLIDLIDDNAQLQGPQRDAFRSAKQRLNVELQLSPGVQANPVSLQLPASVGGQLETVREVVADAISDSRDAGIPINLALQFFALGDTALNQGKYLSAFESYRDAYRELLQ